MAEENEETGQQSWRAGRLMRGLMTMALTLVLMCVSASAFADIRPAPWARGGASNPEDLQVKLVTFGPGSDVASWFGHTAIAVEDQRLNMRRIYNYGMFSADPAMVAKYVMGRLEFWVAPTPYGPTLQSYAQQDRDVRLLTINLPPDRRAKVAEFLEENIKPENRTYLYHHYYDNCATRIRDVFDLATDGQFEAYGTKTPSRMSLRDHTRRHAVWPILDFGMMYAMSEAIDAPIMAWDEMFLPVELERQVKAFSYLNDEGELVPLAGEEEIFAVAKDRPQTPDEPYTLWPWLFLLGVTITLVGGLLGWQYTRSQSRLWRVFYGLYHAGVGFFFGGAGVLILFMWTLTDHSVTYANENLFWTNPLTFLVTFVGLGFAFGREAAQRRLPLLWKICAGLAIVGQVLKITPWLDQDTWLTVALCAPVIFGMAAVAHFVEKRSA